MILFATLRSCSCYLKNKEAEKSNNWLCVSIWKLRVALIEVYKATDLRKFCIYFFYKFEHISFLKVITSKTGTLIDNFLGIFFKALNKKTKGAT